MTLTPARAGVWAAISADTVARPGHPGEPGGLWAELRHLTDAAEFVPRLAPDIEVKEFALRWGNDYTMIANPRELLHYRLEPGEYAIFKLIDGRRSIKEIVVERMSQAGDVELDEVAGLVGALEEGNFLDHQYVDTDEAVRRALDPLSARRRKLRVFTRTLSIEWSGAERLVRWCYDHGVKWFFEWWVAALTLVLAAVGIVAFVANVQSKKFALTGKSLAVGFLVLLALDYLMVFFHELGHAVVLTRNGRRVKSAGFMIYFGSPAFFVDVSDALMISRRQRMLQSFAGPYTHFLTGAVASLVVWFAPGWVLSPTLYRFAVLDYFVLFMNLVPMLELDGYHILSDLIQVPDLRPRSLEFFQHEALSKLRKRQRFTRQEVGLFLYAVLGVAFSAFSFYTAYFFWKEIFGGLVSTLWQKGTATRLILVALALFVGGPLIRGILQFFRSALRKLRLLSRRLRFRLEQGWRVEAATMIDALSLFDDVPEDVLSDLAGRVRLRTLAAGQPVFRQGDRASAFYVVRRGLLEVVEEDPDSGVDRTLRTLGRGDSFGELALMDGSPRTATVRPIEESQVFEIDKGTFDQLLADMVLVPEFAPSLQQIAELRSMPTFAHLDAERLKEVLEQGAWLNVAPGEAVVREGDVGDAFYTIASGQVVVDQGGSVIRTMGPGSHFGELALLFDTPRTATVRARTPVRVFRLDREGFNSVVAGAFRRGTLHPHAATDATWEH